MPSTAFVDNEVIELADKENKNSKEEKSIFPEHDFLMACFKSGVTTEALERFTYLDIIKMFITNNSANKKQSDVRNATQQDINKFLK